MYAKKCYWRSLEVFKEFTGYIDKRMKPFYCPLQQKRNKGLYAVHIHAKVGFFAQLNWCLCIFSHCHRYGLKPAILLSSPFYVRTIGDNWLEYFFENRKLTETDKNLINNGFITFSQVSDIDQLGLPLDQGSAMTLENANQLFWRYLTLKQDITDYVDAFVAEHFVKRSILGVHYRGTDKKSEAKPVPWEYVAATISNYLTANPQVDCLFIASDEENFIEWIKGIFNHIDILSHEDTLRSRDGKAVHTQPGLGDNYIKGKEALINSLLLSQCTALIRTSSFLSAWSSIFNPALPVIMLNRPYDDKLWFPDELIVQKSMNQYLPVNQI